MRDDGELRYCANRDYAGPDSIGVTITDDDASERSLTVTVPVTIVDGMVPVEECSMEFTGEGCCSGSRPGGGGLLLAAVVGGAIGRRRRR